MLPDRNFGGHHKRWDGWSLTDDGFLADPAGNKYTPEDIEATFYGRQLYVALSGDQSQIRTLKKLLEEKLNNLPTPTIQITWVTQGGEEKKKRVELT